jgi:hypothetical protein
MPARGGEHERHEASIVGAVAVDGTATKKLFHGVDIFFGGVAYCPATEALAKVRVDVAARE